MKRPRGIILLAFLSFFGAVASTAIGIILAQFCLGFGSCGSFRYDIFAISLVPALLLLVEGYGLARFRNWSRVVALVLLPCAFIFVAWNTGYWVHGPGAEYRLMGIRLLGLAIAGLIVWYLRRRDVKAYFQPKPVPPEPGS